MRYIVVLSFDLDDPEGLVDILKAMDPPNLPGFANEVRIAIGSTASYVEEWLSEDD